MKKSKEIVITIKKLFKLLIKYNKSYLILLSILTLLNSILPLLSLINTQNIINSIQLNDNINKVYINLLFFVLINISTLILTTAFSYILGKYKEVLYLKINQEVLRKTNELDYVDFENSEIYDLLQRAEMEAGVRPISIVTSLLNIVSAIITIFGSILILMAWKWWISICFILLSLCALAYYKKIGDLEYTTIYNRTKNERMSWYISHLLTKDNSIKEIKLLNLFPYLMRNFDELREKFYNQNISIMKLKTKFICIYKLGNILFMSIIVLIGIIETFKSIILVGNLMTYINATTKVDNSLNSISNSFFSLYQDCLHASNIITFLELKCKEKDSKTKKRNYLI